MPNLRSLICTLAVLATLLSSCVSVASAQASSGLQAQVAELWFFESREPNGSDLKALMEALQLAIRSNNVEQAAGLTRAFYPNEQRIKAALKNDPSQDLIDFYNRMKPKDEASWARLFRTSRKRTQVSVYGATTEEIVQLTDIVHREFPGGAVKMAATHFKPGVRFYEVEITEPDEPLGMKFHLFFWDGEAWCMLGPIWRAKRSGRGR